MNDLIRLQDFEIDIPTSAATELIDACSRGEPIHIRFYVMEVKQSPGERVKVRLRPVGRPTKA